MVQRLITNLANIQLSPENMLPTMVLQPPKCLLLKLIPKILSLLSNSVLPKSLGNLLFPDSQISIKVTLHKVSTFHKFSIYS